VVLAKVVPRIVAPSPSLTGHPWIVFFAYRDLLILLKDIIPTYTSIVLGFLKGRCRDVVHCLKKIGRDDRTEGVSIRRAFVNIKASIATGFNTTRLLKSEISGP